MTRALPRMVGPILDHRAIPYRRMSGGKHGEIIATRSLLDDVQVEVGEESPRQMAASQNKSRCHDGQRENAVEGMTSRPRGEESNKLHDAEAALIGRRHGCNISPQAASLQTVGLFLRPSWGRDAPLFSRICDAPVLAVVPQANTYVVGVGHGAGRGHFLRQAGSSGYLAVEAGPIARF